MSKLNKVSIAVIFASWLAVLIVGLVSKTPMIGDEVTHYYMLVTQSERLPTPCFQAQIPFGLEGRDGELREYPHVATWHYLGAILFRLTGSFAVVQVYHSMFLLQLLSVVFLIARKIGGGREEGGLLAVVSVASLPMTLIFSVAFYQDVPATAQVLTAFWLLMSGRWLLAAGVVSLALGMKETMMLFMPVYFMLLTAVVWKCAIWRRITAIAVTLVILLSSCWFASYVLMKYVRGNYYPYEVLKITINKILLKLPVVSEKYSTGGISADQAKAVPRVAATLFRPDVIANHPGDLRRKANWFVYGGGVLWLLVAMGLAGLFVRKRGDEMERRSGSQNLLMLLAGASYIVLTCLFLEAPEARFFMPAVIMLSIPAAVYAVRVPQVRLWLWLFILASVIQSGVVLHKTYALRHVSVGIMEAIDYLKREPPVPSRIFMYPEGNYRLFPCNHEWYLDYKLRDFWRADNNHRLDILHTNGIGAVVVKKHLVGTIDPEMNNLGIYPDFFVRDLDSDARFRKVLDNRAVTIYRVPADGE